MDFNEKNILVVGGSSGIGQSILESLSSFGAHLWNASRRPSGIAGVHDIELDVTSSFSVIEGIPDQIHGLVYCPGTINLKPFQGLKLDDFQSEIEVNLLGAIKVIKACLRPLRSSKNAAVVLFSTVAVQQGMSYHASIASAKGAVEGLTRSLAAEYARANVRFNAIAPSLTNTPLAQHLLSSEEKAKASAERHPLKRVGEVSDISSAATYLLSEEASWMTGQILHLDGGMSSVRPI